MPLENEFRGSQRVMTSDGRRIASVSADARPQWSYFAMPDLSRRAASAPPQPLFWQPVFWSDSAFSRLSCESDSFEAAAPLVMPAIAFMGLISGAGVLWGETECAKSVPSSEMGVIFATEPVWAAVFASVLLHDEITTNELVGGACIVIACLCLQLPEEQLSAALFGPTTATSSQSQ